MNSKAVAYIAGRFFMSVTKQRGKEGGRRVKYTCWPPAATTKTQTLFKLINCVIL